MCSANCKIVLTQVLSLQKYFVMAMVAAIPALWGGCSGSTSEKQSLSDNEALMQFGDSVLRRNDVVARIPVGLSPQDSVRMFDAIVQSWLEDMLLGDMAARNNIDMSRIDRLVSDYRNSLIVSQYRDRVLRSHSPKLSDKQLRKYYDEHISEMVLERPIVKGIYLSVDASAPGLENLRVWMSSFDAENLDNIDRYGIDRLMDYEYFADSWLDWQVLEQQFDKRLPLPEEILKKGGSYRDADNGVERMLLITDVMAPGKTMPYDFARRQISDILTDSKIENYEVALLENLYRKALESRQLQVMDPALSSRLNEKGSIINRN